jgi:Fe-S-cluster containining protein
MNDPVDDLFELTASEEAARAGAQIDEVGLLAARPASQRRHDALHVAAAEAVVARGGPAIACRRGCSWCCQFRVAVRTDEALRLGAWLRSNADAAEVERIRAQAAAHAATLAELPLERKMRVNLTCPLLVDQACSAYEARPHTCRAFHATDVEGCEASVVDPERDDIPEALVPEVMAVSAGHDEGVQRALEVRGHSLEVYELNAALAVVLGDLTAVARWEAGEAILAGAEFR